MSNRIKRECGESLSSIIDTSMSPLSPITPSTHQNPKPDNESVQCIKHHISQPKLNVQQILEDITRTRVNALREPSARKFGRISAIVRGANRTPAQVSSLLIQKYIEKDRAGGEVIALVTKILPEKAVDLMPLLYQQCLELSLRYPIYDPHAGLVILTNINGISQSTKTSHQEDGHRIKERKTNNPNYLLPPIEEMTDSGTVVVLTAGASDNMVGEEVCAVLRMNGVRVNYIPRYSVELITQSMDVPDILEEAEVVIAVAGQEGTFPNIVGGLTSRPVIAIPTSGSVQGEMGPLHVNLNNCVPGIVVVNVDDGVDAALEAFAILRRSCLKRKILFEGRRRPISSGGFRAEAEEIFRSYRSPHPSNDLHDHAQDLWNKLWEARTRALKRNTDLRMGVPGILGSSKTPHQIVDELTKRFEDLVVKRTCFATRIEEHIWQEVDKIKGNLNLKYDKDARIVWIDGEFEHEPSPMDDCKVAVVSAGTADRPVTAEICRVLRLNKVQVQEMSDFGVNQIFRSLTALSKFDDVDIIIAVAGMEGTLPGFIGTFTDLPVVAVPTHVGYGASQGGLSALFAMLHSSAPGIAVVNIDNGFGAAIYAMSVCRQFCGI